VEETTAGDPMSLLRWTSKSTRRIAEELARCGHRIDAVTAGRCLGELGYSLQANVKTKEGRQHAVFAGGGACSERSPYPEAKRLLVCARWRK